MCKLLKACLLAASLLLALPAEAASLLPNGEQTFLDQNGLPYAAGTVGFYIPNTLTPSTTWADAAQTTPNANPVVLDSAGRAVVYGQGTYRQILKDVFGNVVWDKLTSTINPGSSLVVATVSALRAGNFGLYPTLTLSGYLSATDNGGGTLVLAASDHSSTDNSCTIFVDSGGNRFYRSGGLASVNIDQCGAAPGATDNATAINAAFSATQNITCTQGNSYTVTGLLVAVAGDNIDLSGCKIVANPTGGSTLPFMNVSVSNVTVKGLHLTTTLGTNGIEVGATASANGITIRDFFCDSISTGISGCVTYKNGAFLTIDNLRCVATGYCILQQSNGSWTGLTASHVTCSDMYSDCFEQNAGVGGRSVYTVINSMVFDGCHSFPSPATECRAIGTTSAIGLTISNSSIRDANGDACFHFEGTTAAVTLTGNVIADCDTANSNDGYIYILTSSANVTSSGNVFLFNGNESGGLFAFSTSSGVYTNQIISSGDIFQDLSGTHSFGGFDIDSHTGQVSITGANGSGLGTFIAGISTDNLTVTGSTTTNTTNDIFYSTGTQANGTGGTNVSIIGNHFSCTNWCLQSNQNTNATGQPTNWAVTNNWFSGTSGNGVSLSSAVNSWGSGNWYSSGLTLHSVAVAAGANTVDYKDFLQGSGVIH